MSERFDIKTGLWEVQSEIMPEIVIPSFADSQKKAIANMLTAQADAAKGNIKPITRDYETYIRKQEEAGQETVRTLGEKGLLLANPDLILHIGRKDWSDRNRIGYMNAQGLMYYDNVDIYVDLLEGITEYQESKTGIMTVLDKNLTIRNRELSWMKEKIAISDEKISEATECPKRVIMLGVLANLDYYTQSVDKRTEMRSKGKLGVFTEYTADTDACGCIAILYDQNSDGRINLKGWRGGAYPHAGSRAAVVKGAKYL